ncbi:hypothetical protein QTP88_012207 [Uroleucon formosanum]
MSDVTVVLVKCISTINVYTLHLAVVLRIWNYISENKILYCTIYSTRTRLIVNNVIENAFINLFRNIRWINPFGWEKNN